MAEEKKHLTKAVKIFLVIFIIITPAVWVSLMHLNFEGDLTRIGKVSDNLFAPGEYTIDLSPQKNADFEKAEILVIGDSFSINLQWQKELQKNKSATIATITWEGAIKGCVTNEKSAFFFKGSTIIFQSVERNFIKNLTRLTSCPNIDLAKKPDLIVYEPQTKAKKFFDLDGQFFVGILTIINSNLIKSFDSFYKIYNIYSSAHIVPINDGCNYFSNSHCKYLLVYKNDLKTERFDTTPIDKMVKINASLPNKRLIWVIVPNKYSIYIDFKNKEFFDLVHEKRLGPDLFSDFTKNKTSIVDLYQPNDTHLSGTGFTYLGKRIKAFIKE